MTSDTAENEPNRHIRVGNDDSFDAELDLLESTLSELKETEPHCGKNLTEQYSDVKPITSISVDPTKCDILLLKKPTISQTDGGLDFKNTSVESSNLFVSSTIQHLKSADRPTSNLKDDLKDHLVNKLEQTITFHSKDCSPGCKRSLHLIHDTMNPTEVIDSNHNGHKNNGIVVSNCDSSMEDYKEVEASERNTVLTPVDLNEPEVLNLECSPIPSPGSPNVLNAVESVLEGLKNNVLVQKSIGENGSPRVEGCNVDKPNDDDHKETKSNAILTPDFIDKTSQNDNYCTESNCTVKSPALIDTSTSNQETNQVEQSSNLGLDSINLKIFVEDKKALKVETLTENIELKEVSNIYCSTPVVSKEKYTHSQDKEESLKDGTEFGYISPLDKTHTKKKMNLKRKKLGLECIEEVNECLSDIPVEKKLKLVSVSNQNVDCNSNLDDDKSSSNQCFEPPAKAILKKWQPSRFFRNYVSGSFLVLDECGECDEEDHVKSNESLESVVPDDFEVVCKSLTEELMKGSSNNVETLEKYHSQVQQENQIDNEKFDEIIQELTLNYELDEKTSLTLRSMDCSAMTEAEHMNESVENLSEAKASEYIGVTANKTGGEFNEESKSECTKTTLNIMKAECSEKLSCKEETPAQSSISKVEVYTSSKNKHGDISSAENVTSHYAGGKDMTIDEEDVLLEENTDQKKKPYEFFEFVSTDPQENEDNYNPEWQKLGQLTSDEERYKAVRDRWRSLVPPDPNRDLTCRQWRERNHKQSQNVQSANDDHQMYIDHERNQLCTAVFEMKIKKMVQEMEISRVKMYDQRQKDFTKLANVQDSEQRILRNRGGNNIDMAILNKQHLEECCQLKIRYDEELKRIRTITEEKIRILKNASDEVLLFQKFYRGVGAGDDQVCLYMTDIQVQELMETEQMLEQYSKFYQ
uniref:Uncharacterized protein n=2 Tax=Graphocephala atropunctata TaxID=36148 RepID=A0A1B6M0Z1_9HEMI